jgi:hypothetical protein
MKKSDNSGNKDPEWDLLIESFETCATDHQPARQNA